MQSLINTIETAFENRADITPSAASTEVVDAINETIAMLDSGKLRVAEPTSDGWKVNEWAKKAVLLSFRINDNQVIDAGHTQFYDKVPLKYQGKTEAQFKESGGRVVPQAVVRNGCYVAPNVVLMPSYTNIGAYIDEGTMVDTWATVGSCAQIGKNVHLSGGVGTQRLLKTIVLSVREAKLLRV